jgi:predicted RNase H-like HicB family nuclease
MSTPRRLTVILEPEADGGYSVHCPALPGCVSQGDSRQEALANILEAITLVLEVIQDGGAPFPDETPEVIVGEIAEILKTRAEDGLPLTLETAEVQLPEGVLA